MRPLLLTIGSGNASWAAFTNHLDQFGVQIVADVRSFPRSRIPAFNQVALGKGLNERGIGYHHFGRQLGGYVTDRSVSYAHRVTETAFVGGIEEVLELARQSRVALLCAEGEPLDCHRALVISRYLVEAGLTDVTHIHKDGRLETHAELEDRMMRRVGVHTDLFSDRAELLSAAYTKRLIRMGLRP